MVEMHDRMDGRGPGRSIRSAGRSAAHHFYISKGDIRICVWGMLKESKRGNIWGWGWGGGILSQVQALGWGVVEQCHKLSVDKSRG